MEAPESITGESMLKLIDRLKKEKTIIKLHILGTSNEGLSIVLGIETVNETPCLIIDFPTGTEDNIFQAQGKKAIIKFIDRERVHYNFRSVITGVSRQNVYILLPKVIYRLQRRKYFRTPPPIATKVIINEEGKRYEFDMLNISEGGALISHPSDAHDDSKFFKGALKTLVIVYNQDNNKQTIKVNKAEIIRIEKIWETRRYQYGIQFIDYGTQEENDIRNFIYSCQRRLLKSRYSPEDE